MQVHKWPLSSLYVLVHCQAERWQTSPSYSCALWRIIFSAFIFISILMACPCCGEAPSQHDAATTIIHSRNGFRQVLCSFWCSLDIVNGVLGKELNFCLIRHQNLFLYPLRIIKMSWQTVNCHQTVMWILLKVAYDPFSHSTTQVTEMVVLLTHSPISV